MTTQKALVNIALVAFSFGMLYATVNLTPGR